MESGRSTDRQHHTSTPHAHVEHRDRGERTRVPLLLVLLQGGVQRVGEFSNDGDRPLVAWEVGLLGAVVDLLVDEQGDDDGEDGRDGGVAEESAGGHG